MICGIIKGASLSNQDFTDVHNLDNIPILQLGIVKHSLVLWTESYVVLKYKHSYAPYKFEPRSKSHT